MKFTYNGTDERIFPSFSLVVKPGDSFEAPDDFSMANVSPATPATPVADPTPTVGESNATSTTIG